MNYQMDVSKEYETARKGLFTISLLFSLLFSAVIIADVLLVVLANESYLVNLIISIVISVLFTWFAIYFFTNIFNDVNAKYVYYKGYESGLKEEGEVELVDIDDKLQYINGLYVYAVKVKYINGLETTDKVIYTVNKDLGYKAGDKLSVITYRRILVKAVSHSWMN